MAKSSSILDVPRRANLLSRLRTANNWASGLLVVELVCIAGLGLVIDWPAVQQQSLITTVAIAAVVGPFVMSILTHLATKKKEIGDLQEQTRFGKFDKHQLRTLVDDTMRRLHLPARRLPVYIVADKYLNASMLHVGLGFLLRSLNGIYLNRQALHKLDAPEVQDIIGHELGHYYHYYLISDRFRIVTLILGALASIFVVQWIGLTHFGSMIVLMLCSAALWKVVSLPHAANAWTIEYLCDDLGAQVHGVAVSVSGLMKLGAEAELMTAIQQQAVLSKSGQRLSAHEIVEAITAAIPYGHTTREDLEVAVQKSLQQRAQQGASVAGFLRYMWQSDVDAEADEEIQREMRKLSRLQNVPRMNWESLLDRSGEIRFDDRSLEQLVQMIEQYPDQVLFRTPEAIGDLDASHPPLKNRILYLWYNRSEIEAQQTGGRRW